MQAHVTCETIGSLDDGTAKASINTCLDIIRRDIEDRGDDEKPREVNIKIKFLKVSGKDVAITCIAWPVLPKFQGSDTIARLSVESGKPELLFQDMAPDDPDQETIDREIERNTRRKPKTEEE